MCRVGYEHHLFLCLFCSVLFFEKEPSWSQPQDPPASAAPGPGLLMNFSQVNNSQRN